MQIQDENKFNNILKIVQKLGQQGQQGQLLLTDWKSVWCLNVGE